MSQVSSKTNFRFAISSKRATAKMWETPDFDDGKSIYTSCLMSCLINGYEIWYYYSICKKNICKGKPNILKNSPAKCFTISLRALMAPAFARGYGVMEFK